MWSRIPDWQGLAPYCKAKKKYKLESDLGATWAIWLPTYVDSKTQLRPKSDNVNKQKFMRSAWAYYVTVMALNNMHPCRFSLKLFVVTFMLTYTFYTARLLIEISTNERPASYFSQPIRSSFAIVSQPFAKSTKGNDPDIDFANCKLSSMIRHYDDHLYKASIWHCLDFCTDVQGLVYFRCLISTDWSLPKGTLIT